VVEEGGIGAGTVIRFQMRILGRLRTFHAAITEPEPGGVLVETDLDTTSRIETTRSRGSKSRRVRMPAILPNGQPFWGRENH